MTVDLIDFSVPVWLIRYYHVIGTISLIFDAFSIYLIVFKSGTFDNFRFFLLNFQIACSFTDFHITFLMQPVPFYPLMSGMAMGFLSTYLNISLHFCLTLVIFLYIYQVASMIVCFVRKNQIIAGGLTSYRIPEVIQLALIAFLTVYTFLVVGIYFCLSVNEDEKLEFVETNYPELYPEFLKLPNFSIYNPSSYLLLMVIIAVIGGLLAFGFLCLVLLNIFRMFSFLKTQLSTSNLNKHRAAVRSLLAQFATSSVCFSPPLFLVFVVFFQLPHAQFIVELLLVIACSHSSLNVIVLISTFPPFRKFVIRLVLCRRKCCFLIHIIMYSVDFSIPWWLIRYYHVIGTVSLIFDAFSIFLIVFKSSSIDNFRFFLLNFQIACLLTDIQLTFLMQPVPLYSLVSGYSMGFLPTYFNTSTHFCLCVIIFLLIYQIGSMIGCFVKKHQTIAKTLGKYQLSIGTLSFLLGFFIIYTLTVTGIFWFLRIPESFQMDYIRMNFLEYLDGFKSLPNFSIYEADHFFLGLVIFAVSGGILAFSLFVLILFNIFRMLAQLKFKISQSNYKKHRSAVYSLIAQFSTSSVCFVPPVTFPFVILMGIENSQVIVEVLVMIACLHSSLNVFVLVLTFPPYRKFVFHGIFTTSGLETFGVILGHRCDGTRTSTLEDCLKINFSFEQLLKKTFNCMDATRNELICKELLMN